MNWDKFNHLLKLFPLPAEAYSGLSVLIDVKCACEEPCA